MQNCTHNTYVDCVYKYKQLILQMRSSALSAQNCSDCNSVTLVYFFKVILFSLPITNINFFLTLLIHRYAWHCSLRA